MPDQPFPSDWQTFEDGDGVYIAAPSLKGRDTAVTIYLPLDAADVPNTLCRRLNAHDGLVKENEKLRLLCVTYKRAFEDSNIRLKPENGLAKAKAHVDTANDLQHRWLEHFVVSNGIVNVDVDGQRILGRYWGNVNAACLRRGWIEYVDGIYERGGRRFKLTDEGIAVLKEAAR